MRVEFIGGPADGRVMEVDGRPATISTIASMDIVDRVYVLNPPTKRYIYLREDRGLGRRAVYRFDRVEES